MVSGSGSGARRHNRTNNHLTNAQRAQVLAASLRAAAARRHNRTNNHLTPTERALLRAAAARRRRRRTGSSGSSMSNSLRSTAGSNSNSNSSLRSTAGTRRRSGSNSNSGTSIPLSSNRRRRSRAPSLSNSNSGSNSNSNSGSFFRPRRTRRRLFNNVAVIVVEQPANIGKRNVENFAPFENMITLNIPVDPWVILNKNGKISQPALYHRETLNRIIKNLNRTNPLNRTKIIKIGRAPINVKKAANAKRTNQKK